MKRKADKVKGIISPVLPVYMFVTMAAAIKSARIQRLCFAVLAEEELQIVAFQNNVQHHFQCLFKITSYVAGCLMNERCVIVLTLKVFFLKGSYNLTCKEFV
jgi:hypothetical protein